MTIVSDRDRIDLDDAGQRQALLRIAEHFATPCYVYDFDAMRTRVEALRQAFSYHFDISYAVKANPNRAVLRSLGGLVDHFDISSGGELALAKESGFDVTRATFVGPTKQPWEINAAIACGCGHLVVESLEEISAVSQAARQSGKLVRIIIRVNPSDLPKGFGVSMSRRATIFGIDEEDLDAAISAALAAPGIQLDGFHIYAGTQCLDEGALAENIINACRIFTEASRIHALRPSLLIIGSGFGIPYFDGVDRIDLAKIATSTLDSLQSLYRDCLGEGGRVSLELGRYIVGEAGAYLTRVTRIKKSRDKILLALDGGMNHFLSASGNLGSVIKRNYPARNLNASADTPQCAYELAGPLCTNIDLLGRGATLSETKAGDILAIASAGAYGLTASPTGFISHPMPREVLISCAGDQIEDITQSGPLVAPPDWPGIGSPRHQGEGAG